MTMTDHPITLVREAIIMAAPASRCKHGIAFFPQGPFMGMTLIGKSQYVYWVCNCCARVFDEPHKPIESAVCDTCSHDELAAPGLETDAVVAAYLIQHGFSHVRGRIWRDPDGHDSLGMDANMELLQDSKARELGTQDTHEPFDVQPQRRYL